jgi:hypothetical protein
MVEAGKGQIHLSIEKPQGARSLFPDDWNTLTYQVTFTPKAPIPGTEEVLEEPFTTDHTETLRVGFWDVYVEALDGTTPVGDYKELNVEVKATPTTQVVARIMPITTGAPPNGTLSWKIKYPDALVDEAYVNYGILAPFKDKDMDILDSGDIGLYGINDATAGLRFATDSLPPGSYTFIAMLHNDDSKKIAGRAESVHIYSGLTTSVDWEFFDTSFKYTIEYNVTVDIVHSTNVTINSATLKTTALIDGRDVFLPTPSTSTSGNTYTFTLDVDEEATELSNVSLEIVTATNTPNKLTYSFVGTTTLAPTPPIISLGTVNVYAAKVTAGTGGQAKINGSVAGTTLQQDFLSGSAVTLTAVPGTGYKTDTWTGLPGGFTTSGEDRGFTITADAVLINVTFAELGSIHVTIDAEGDMIFTNLDSPIVLSKAGPGTVNIAMTNAAYSTAEWYVDGAWKVSAKNFTLSAADYRIGTHDLSILVVIDGHTYSKQATFQVTQ